MFRTLICCVVVSGFVCVNASSAQEATETAFDAKQILGDWEYVSGMRGGEEVEKERLVGTVTVTEKTFTVPGGPGMTFLMEYELDIAQDPAHIDLTIKEGPAPEGSAQGLIKVENGQMTFCYDPTGQKRPAAFESTEDNGAFMFVLKKAE